MNQERTFGVEFECFGDLRAVKDALDEAGIPVRDQSHRYYHSTGINGKWEIKADSSIRPRHGRGMEIVSPRLTGDEGLAQIEKVLAAVNSAGADVNSSCGTHIHLGMQNEIENGTVLRVARNVEMIATRFNHSINQLLAPSRRNAYYSSFHTDKITVGDRGDWSCGKIESELIKIKNDFKSERAFNRSDRAHRRSRHVNLTNLPRAIRRFATFGDLDGEIPTIEIRAHGGTLDAKKITNWIKLWQAIFETAAAGRPITQNVIWKDRGTNELGFFFWNVLKTVSKTEKKELVTFFKARAKKLNAHRDIRRNAKGETSDEVRQNLHWRQIMLLNNSGLTPNSQMRLSNLAFAGAVQV